MRAGTWPAPAGGRLIVHAGHVPALQHHAFSNYRIRISKFISGRSAPFRLFHPCQNFPSLGQKPHFFSLKNLPPCRGKEKISPNYLPLGLFPLPPCLNFPRFDLFFLLPCLFFPSSWKFSGNIPSHKRRHRPCGTSRVFDIVSQERDATSRLRHSEGSCAT